MCDVAILAQAEVHLSITIVICHCGSSAMSFRDENGWRIYGPVETELIIPWLNKKQVSSVWKKFHTTPFFEGWVWGGSTCTTQCKACFGYRTRSMLSDRSIPCVTTRSVRC